MDRYCVAHIFDDASPRVAPREGGIVGRVILSSQLDQSESH